MLRRLRKPDKPVWAPNPLLIERLPELLPTPPPGADERVFMGVLENVERLRAECLETGRPHDQIRRAR